MSTTLSEKTQSEKTQCENSNCAEVEAAKPVRVLRPAVDIHETGRGFVLEADTPGIKEDGVNLRIENDTLFIEAAADAAEGAEAVRFERSFTLGRNIDRETVRAELKQGVLSVTLQKQKAAQSKKIAVQYTA